VSTPKSPFRRWLGSRGHHRPDALSDTTSKATRDCDFISIALPWPPQFGGSGQNVSARPYHNLLAASLQRARAASAQADRQHGRRRSRVVRLNARFRPGRYTLRVQLKAEMNGARKSTFFSQLGFTGRR
jgi:hypothetical protein